MKQAWDLLGELRDAEWTVAIHNDYRWDGVLMTFWLLTRAVSGVGMIGVKGEGHTDLEALEQCAAQAQALSLFKPLP